MTTLEKVARTLVDPDCSPLDHDGSPLWVYKLPKARAALEALRNPTPDMCIAGGIAIAESMKTAETHVDNANECWRRMIGTILDENDG